MALDTFVDIYGKVLLRCPHAGKHLCQDWVRNAFRRVAERRRWSWLTKRGQFVVPASYTTGTVTVVNGLTTVAGVGTVWTPAMIGRQFRLGSSPIYTISQWNSATSIALDLPWGDISQVGVGYEIYQAYMTPPADFYHFITLWDPALNWQLNLNFQQKELNYWDARRTWAGNAYVVAALDYSSSGQGTVGEVLQVRGTAGDPDPVSTGTYTGAADGVFVIECTGGGASGVATFQWKKDNGAYTVGVVTVDPTVDPNPMSLQDGVQIYWPAGVVYVLGDVWVIQAKAVNNVGIPRYELWPHQKAQRVYPYFYRAMATDLDDDGAVLPRYIRGDLLMEMALSDAAATPAFGDQKNPYYDVALASRHEAKSERMIAEMERQDEEIYMQDVEYACGLPYAVFPGADFWQQHAV